MAKKVKTANTAFCKKSNKVFLPKISEDDFLLSRLAQLQGEEETEELSENENEICRQEFKAPERKMLCYDKSDKR